jgi:hypothetical protein
MQAWTLGCFCSVLTSCHRPLQVQKSAEQYTEAAQDEIDLLAAIAGHMPLSAEGAAACVRMLDHFEHRGPHGRHVCMVFEVQRQRQSCWGLSVDYSSSSPRKHAYLMFLAITNCNDVQPLILHIG